jgi:putative transcriptional regulator
LTICRLWDILHIQDIYCGRAFDGKSGIDPISLIGLFLYQMDFKIEIKIEDVLKRRERSVYWLAKETGISYTTLWRLKTDKALGINFSTLESLCKALDCDPGDLVKLKDKEETKEKKTGSVLKRAAGSSH